MVNKYLFITLLVILLLLSNDIFPQQKDTTWKDTWSSIVLSNSDYKDSSLIKAQADDLLDDLGISSNRKKIALVRKYREHFPIHNRMEPVKWYTQYELWLVNLKTKYVFILAKVNDTNFGIYGPSWSPDGKWISFKTFSIEGHSPATTDQTWVVDSTGNGLKHILLPDPYNKFSNYKIKWEGRHMLIIKGVAMKFIDGKWNDLEKIFSYDCESKIVRTIK